MRSSYIYLSGDHREIIHLLPEINRPLAARGYETKWVTPPLDADADHVTVIQTAIEQSWGVLHLIGNRYGAEPPEVESVFGRCSYAQYECHYAQYIGKPLCTHLLQEGEAFPRERDEITKLQIRYRQTFANSGGDEEVLKSKINTLCDLADELRKRMRLMYVTGGSFSFAAFLIGLYFHWRNGAM